MPLNKIKPTKIVEISYLSHVIELGLILFIKASFLYEFVLKIASPGSKSYIRHFKIICDRKLNAVNALKCKKPQVFNWQVKTNNAFLPRKASKLWEKMPLVALPHIL